MPMDISSQRHRTFMVEWHIHELEETYALENRQRLSLPGYPFEHKEFWLDPPSIQPTENIVTNYNHPVQETIALPRNK